MPAGDVTAGKNHHHQGRTNCQRRDDATARANSGTAYRQDKKKRSDEFSDVLVHRLAPNRSSLRKAIRFEYETLVPHALTGGNGAHRGTSTCQILENRSTPMPHKSCF